MVSLRQLTIQLMTHCSAYGMPYAVCTRTCIQCMNIQLHVMHAEAEELHDLHCRTSVHIYTGTIRHAYDYRYMYEIGVPWLHRRCFLPYWAYM